METDNPKISVIVPVYNVEKYLPCCIDSILGQTFTDFELLLIDDGSKDKSGKICDEYAEKDKRIRVFHKENGGVSSARNVGLDNAQGEFICFGDSDDYFLNKALELLYDRSIKTGAEIVLGNSLRLENDKFTFVLNIKNEVYQNVLLSIKHLALWGYMFNINLIRNNNIQFINSLSYSEDRLFIYQLACECKIMAFCNDPVYVYRINSSSACFSRDGVKKACNQFDAAFYINKIANKYKNTDEEIFKYLLIHSRNLIKSGLYQFVENKFSIKDFYTIKGRYTNMYGHKFKSTLRFYIYFVNTYIKFTLRKLKAIIIKSFHIY